MEQQILILHTRAFDFKDDQEKRVQGITVHYIMPGVAVPEGSKGFEPIKASLKADRAKNLGAVPGLYNGAFGLRQDAKGTKLILNDVEFLAPVELGEAS